VIEFRWHLASNSSRWVSYYPEVANAVLQSPQNYHIRVDGDVYKNWQAEWLIKVYNKQRAWRILQNPPQNPKISRNNAEKG